MNWFIPANDGVRAEMCGYSLPAAHRRQRRCSRDRKTPLLGRRLYRLCPPRLEPRHGAQAQRHLFLPGPGFRLLTSGHAPAPSGKWTFLRRWMLRVPGRDDLPLLGYGHRGLYRTEPDGAERTRRRCVTVRSVRRACRYDRKSAGRATRSPADVRGVVRDRGATVCSMPSRAQSQTA